MFTIRRVQQSFKRFTRFSSGSSDKNIFNGSKSLSEQIKESHLKMYNQDIVQQQVEILLEPVSYFKRKPSCPTVMNICDTVNPWVGASEEHVKEISDYWLNLFSTIVMLDDFLDGSDVRKGSPSAHIAFGVPRTVVAASLGQFVVFNKAVELCPNSSEVVRNFFYHYFRANGMEIFWRETLVAPTFEEYISITALKWTVLQHATNMLQLRAGNTRDLSDIVRVYSVFLAISNDYSDFILNSYEGKSICDDMTEGKFTMPAIYAHKFKGNEEIREILKMRSKDESVKKRYVSILKETGSFDFTKKYLQQLYGEITEKIKEIGENPKMQEKIDGEMKKILTSEIAI